MKKRIVAVIIPVFNSLSYTKTCLNNLYELKSQLTEDSFALAFVVVDDGSTDGTGQWIKNHYPDVHIVTGDGNLWWSGGINKGAEFAMRELDAEYTLWWNNDILPKEDYFQQLFEILKEVGSNTIIGSKVVYTALSKNWSLGGFFDPKTGEKQLNRPHSLLEIEELKPQEADWLPGMGTTIHRKVYEEIGFCDEKRFPQYHGDSDFTFRAKTMGFKVIAYPDLVIFNDNTNTGLIHENNLRMLLKSLTSIKSNFNIKKDILFYQIHAKSISAYFSLLLKYYGYIGGFIKWKVLGLLGIKKTRNLHF